jgi:hypothetical protein
VRPDNKKNSWAEAVTQLLVLIGCACFVRGIWMAWKPGGWISAGVVIAVPALFVAYGNYRGKN